MDVRACMYVRTYVRYRCTFIYDGNFIITYTGELIQMYQGTGKKCTAVFNSKEKAMACSLILGATTGTYV